MGMEIPPILRVLCTEGTIIVENQHPFHFKWTFTQSICILWISANNFAEYILLRSRNIFSIIQDHKLNTNGIVHIVH